MNFSLVECTLGYFKNLSSTAEDKGVELFFSSGNRVQVNELGLVVIREIASLVLISQFTLLL